MTDAQYLLEIYDCVIATGAIIGTAWFSIWWYNLMRKAGYIAFLKMQAALPGTPEQKAVDWAQYVLSNDSEAPTGTIEVPDGDISTPLSDPDAEPALSGFSGLAP